MVHNETKASKLEARVEPYNEHKVHKNQWKIAYSNANLRYKKNFEKSLVVSRWFHFYQIGLNKVYSK